MTLSEMLNKIGDSNYTFQLLDASTIVEAVKRKEWNEVTFITKEFGPMDMIGGSEKVGIVIWLSKKQLNTAKED